MNSVRATTVALSTLLLSAATLGAQTTIDTQGSNPFAFFAGGQTAIGESFIAPNNLYMQTASLWLGGIGVSFSAYLQPFVGSPTGTGPIAVVGSPIYVSAPQTINALGPVRFDFNLGNTPIIAGAQYAFFVAATSGAFFSYGPQLLNTYSGGSAIFSNSGTVPDQQTNVDLGFIARFDGPVTATPEPATIALVGTGLVGLFGIMRRRARGAAASA